MWRQMPIEDREGLTSSRDSTGSGQEPHTSQVLAATPTGHSKLRVYHSFTRLPANWWPAASNLRPAERVPNVAALVELSSASAVTQAQPLGVQGRLGEGPSRWLTQEACGFPRGA